VRSPATCLASLEIVWLKTVFGHARIIDADTQIANACTIERPCNKEAFVSALLNKLAINLPDTSPIRSDAAFQLLALAVESATERPFDLSFEDRVRAPLGLGNTRFLKPQIQIFGNGLSNTSLDGEQAALGLVSTISDLVKLGRAILTSRLLPSATTRRWLKPFTSTSNLRNAVGRPWEIYHYSTLPTDPVIDIYMKTGSVGRYSSQFGLVPSHDVGFAILAVDSEREEPDLNAYADITLGE
jgi:CubicO group peptidase (beta-lactamase class C family)